MELRRRQTHSESLAENGRRARAHSRIRRDEQGSFAAWIQIRWLNDLLRVDAGGWHGQRSPRDMSTTRRARWRASSQITSFRFTRILFSLSARVLILTLAAMIAFASNSLLCRAALKQTSIDAASFTFVRVFSGAEKTRTNVNEAASMLVCFSAAQQRSELLAKAIIAAKVRIRTRALNEKRIRVKRNDVICDDACHRARRVVDMSRGDR